MKVTVCVFALLCVVNVSIVSSQDQETWESYPTTCAEVPIYPMNNFKKEQYFGLWYVQAMYDFTGSDANNCYTSLRLPTVGDKATKLDTFLNLNLDLNTVGRKLQFNGLLTFNKPGYAQFIYNSTDGSFHYYSNFVTSKLVDDNFFTEVRIISTDYTNYSIEYSCWDVDSSCICWLVILSRGRSISPAIQNQINQILDANPIDKTKLRQVKQDIGSCLCISTGSGLVGGLLGLVGGLLNGVGDLLSSLLG